VYYSDTERAAVSTTEKERMAIDYNPKRPLSIREVAVITNTNTVPGKPKEIDGKELHLARVSFHP
jgi:hypothetical protein